MQKLWIWCSLLTALFGEKVSAAYIECYVCAGTGRSDCAKGLVSSMALKVCNVTEQLQTVCLKATATEFNPKLVERSCGTFPEGVDPCKILVSSGVFENCSSCNTDKCNVGYEFNDNNRIE